VPGRLTNTPATLIDRAGLALRVSFTAIVDATVLRATDRQAIEAFARTAAVPFVGLWLEAPAQALLQRLQQRERDASDADAAVLRMPRRAYRMSGRFPWRRLDSSASIDAVREKALAASRPRQRCASNADTDFDALAALDCASPVLTGRAVRPPRVGRLLIRKRELS
jgi:hypothetical protein